MKKISKVYGEIYFSKTDNYPDDSRFCPSPTPYKHLSPLFSLCKWKGSWGVERVCQIIYNYTVLNFGFLVQTRYLRQCDIFSLQKPYNKLYKFCSWVWTFSSLGIFMLLDYTAPNSTWHQIPSMNIHYFSKFKNIESK